MQHLPIERYEEMSHGADLLSHDGHGHKVLRLADNRYIKLFRLKRPFSSALFYPYAARFADSAKGLAQRGIPTVEIESVFRVKPMKRDIVIYHPLDGETLRDTLGSADDPQGLLTRFATFFCLLHEKGIYFRGAHFGNVLVMPDGEFGLIDINEVRLCRPRLCLWKRVRNFKPIFHYREDRQSIMEFGVERFIRLYLEASTIPAAAHESFIEWVKHTHLED